jgi:hypothetical protein
MIDSAVAPPELSEAGVKWAATAVDISIPTIPEQRGEMLPRTGRQVEAFQPVDAVLHGDRDRLATQAGRRYNSLPSIPAVDAISSIESRRKAELGGALFGNPPHQWLKSQMNGNR